MGLKRDIGEKETIVLDNGRIKVTFDRIVNNRKIRVTIDAEKDIPVAVMDKKSVARTRGLTKSVN